MLAVGSPSVPKIYANGFIIGQSTTDISVVLQTNGSVSAVINVSFTTAKSLAIELDKAIKSFEQITRQKLLTIEEITTAMQTKKGSTDVA